MKNYNEDSGKWCILEVDVKYTEKLHELHNERMQIEKIGKLVSNLHDKTEYVIHIRDLKEALNQKLVLKDLVKMLG